jgi:hypothetical protein
MDDISQCAAGPQDCATPTNELPAGRPASGARVLRAEARLVRAYPGPPAGHNNTWSDGRTNAPLDRRDSRYGPTAARQVGVAFEQIRERGRVWQGSTTATCHGSASVIADAGALLWCFRGAGSAIRRCTRLG